MSIVIPAFNEEPLIEQCLIETSQAMQRMGFAYEIIVVDDGSTDKTADLVRDAATSIPNVRLFSQPTNAGKGGALHLGATKARGNLIAFLDADLEIHPNQLADLHTTLFTTRSGAAIGSKHHPQAQVDVRLVRYLLSLAYSHVVRLAFRLPVHDTQTGLKLFERAPLQQALARTQVKGFAHDLELLVCITRLGYRIAETPISVTTVRLTQRISLGDVVRMAFDTSMIWYRSTFTGHYDFQMRSQQETHLRDRNRNGSIAHFADLIRKRARMIVQYGKTDPGNGR